MMAALMTAITLGELLGAGPHAQVSIAGMTLDSRAVEPGAAFVALAGSRDHGLSFAAAAARQGAAAVLYEPVTDAASPLARIPAELGIPAVAVDGLRNRLGRLARDFYWRDAAQPALYGVTGTNGKTTVAWLVAQAMAALGRDCGYVGTLGSGRPTALAPQSLTTPDCLSLHRRLRTLEVDAAAVEVSSHGLVQQRVAGLDFAAAAVTNLSRDHLDAHGSMDAYAAAKRRILALPGLRHVVLNIDDAFASSLVAQVPAGVDTLRVSARAADADVAATALERGFDGLELRVTANGARATIESSLIGDFNAENLVVALGLLLSGGIELERACEALSACRAAPGRLEAFTGASGVHVVVDYAHTPAALDRALAVVRRLGTREVVCVFGCGGDRDRGKRADMGRAAAAADRVVLTDDNPRSEDPAAIVADIVQGLDPAKAVTIEHDRARAIELAVAAAAPGDVVLVAGKGHETTQDRAGAARHFDDREIVRALLGVDS